MIKNSGFTLIEILVVITIIVVMSAAIVFGLSPKNSHQAIKEEAHRFIAKIQLASEESTFQSELLGIVFYRNGYQLMRWVDPNLALKKNSDAAKENIAQPSGYWEKAGEEAFYKKVILPKNMVISLTVNNELIALADSVEEESEEKQKPSLLLLPSSEMTPFTLIFSMQNNPAIQVSVQANELGELTILSADEAFP